MAIFNIGFNYYLGNARYAQGLNINYPTVSYLEGFPHTGISAELTSLLTSASLPFRNVMSQAQFETYIDGSYSIPYLLLHFGTIGDIDDRYSFGLNYLWNSISVHGAGVHPYSTVMYSDLGGTRTDNFFSTDGVNAIARTGNTSTNTTNNSFFDTDNIGTTATDIYWLGVANTTELGLVATQHLLDTDITILNYWYAGLLNNVTSSFNYYSENSKTKSLILSGQYVTSSNEALRAQHYIAYAGKDVLRSGVAEYSLSGSTSQWSGDFLVFDDNPTLEFPTIGEAGVLRVLEGNYTLGKPAALPGDVSNRLWLPLGSWTSNRTLAMEVYSS